MIVVLTGQKRSGKSTAAKILSDYFEPIALADGFKHSLVYAINRYKIFEKSFTYRDANGETDFNREEKIFSKQDTIKIIQFAYYRILGDDQRYLDLDDLVLDFFENEKRENFSFREIMQITGTDIGCNILDEQIWTKIVLYKICDSKKSNFLITDCRQDHEIDLFRKLGAKIVHIKRDTSNIVDKDLHVTEKELKIDEKDIVIHNDSSIEVFKAKLEVIKGL